MDAGTSIPQVELRFFGGRRGLSTAEAVTLGALLMRERNSAARNLSLRISAATVTGDQVKVDSYELKALSALMGVADVGQSLGLLKLQETCVSLTSLTSDGTSRNA